MTTVYKLLMVSAVCLAACSQPQKEEDTTESTAAAVPIEGEDPAKEAFQKKYPEAEEVSWEEDANGYLEANFELNDEKYRADFTKEGQWIETESSIKFNDLPKAVQDAVNKQFDADDITEIEQVDNAQRGLFYDVEFKDKGKNRDIEFRENGEQLTQ